MTATPSSHPGTSKDEVFDGVESGHTSRLGCPTVTLGVLRAVLDHVARCPDITTAAHAILTEAGTVGIRAVAVWNVDGDRLRMVAAAGHDETRLERFVEVPLSAHLPTGDAVVTGEPVLCPDSAALIGRYPLLERFRIYTEALTTFPLHRRGTINGVVSFHFVESIELNSEALTFLEALADIIASVEIVPSALADVVPLRVIASPDGPVDLEEVLVDEADEELWENVNEGTSTPELERRLQRLENQTATMRQMLLFLGAIANERLDEM
jgi:hypothetical protein